MLKRKESLHRMWLGVEPTRRCPTPTTGTLAPLPLHPPSDGFFPSSESAPVAGCQRKSQLLGCTRIEAQGPFQPAPSVPGSSAPATPAYLACSASLLTLGLLTPSSAPGSGNHPASPSVVATWSSAPHPILASLPPALYPCPQPLLSSESPWLLGQDWSHWQGTGACGPSQPTLLFSFILDIMLT